MRVRGLLGGQLDHDAPPGSGRGTRRRRRPARSRAPVSTRHRRPWLVGAQRVLDVDHVRGRRDVGEVAELADQLDVVEHLGELAAEALDLLGGELEAGEAGDVEDLIAAQHWSLILGGGSGRGATWPRRGASAIHAPASTRCESVRASD